MNKGEIRNHDSLYKIRIIIMYIWNNNNNKSNSYKIRYFQYFWQ